MGTSKIGKEFANAIIENDNIEHYQDLEILKLKKNETFESKKNGNSDKILSIQCTDTDACILGLILKTNTTVTKLDLSGNCFRSNGIGDNGAQVIAEALQMNQSLTEVYLYDNNIGDIGGKAIGQALKKNISLRKLSLAFNKIGDIGITEIIEGLKQNKTLKNLYVGHNLFGNSLKGMLRKIIQEHKSIIDWGF